MRFLGQPPGEGEADPHVPVLLRRSGKRHTLKHIGDELGISPETVRQIEMRALKKLKGFSEELKEYVVN